MFKYISVFVSLFFIQVCSSQVGINTTTPNAQLDIKSSNQAFPSNTDGILIPKIDAFPVVNPTADQQGMMVYLTTIVGVNLPGFYYWDNTTTSWISLKGNEDADWYKVATTSAPTSINDNMFHNGNVGIGEVNPLYKLDIKESNVAKTRVANFEHINPGNNLNIEVLKTSINSGINTNGIYYGLNNSMSLSNSVMGIGTNNLYNGTSSNEVCGYRNAFFVSGSGTRFGLSNNFNSGTGVRYGVHNVFSGTANQQVGLYNYFSGTPTFALLGTFNKFEDTSMQPKTGSYNQFINDPTANGINYGYRNSFDGIGGQAKFGFYNEILGNGNGDFYGLNNFVSNSGNGSLVGVKSEINGSGTGNKYGIFNTINPSAGGVHYGVYSSALKANSFAGYFLGRVAIGTSDADKYILPSNRGTLGQIMQTDGVGNVTWQNVSAVIGSNYWSTNGNSATVAGTNFIGTTDNVDLIFKRNGLVAGKIEITNTAFGAEALNSNTTGFSNTAIGVNALRANINGSSNVALGYGALNSNTSGSFNLALHKALTLNTIGSYNLGVGFEALHNNTTASYNCAIGYQALFGNTVGNFNTAIGSSALANNVSGNSNLAIGSMALNSSISASFNLALGNNALRYNTSGSNNVALGLNSLEDNTTGVYNTGVGNSTLKDNINGVDNVAIGNATLQLNVSGSSNTSVGTRSMFYNTTGNSNTALGFNALFRNTSGVGNIGIGFSTLVNNTIGNRNIAIGSQALFNNDNGAYNITIGSEALYNNISGSDNIAIGYQAGYNEIGSNKLYIENSNSSTPLIYGEFDNDIIKINGVVKVHKNPADAEELQLNNTSVFAHSSGNQDFGTGQNEFLLSSREGVGETGGIYGDGNAVSIWSPGDGNLGQPPALVYFLDEDQFDATNTNPYDNTALKSYISPAGAYVQISDKNKKENIEKINNALEKILAISGYTYQFKQDHKEIEKGKEPIKSSGVLAQELEKVLPEAIQKSKDGDYFVDYAAITPLLIEAIKEQQKNIQKQEEKISSLEERLAKLEALLNKQ
ncbi:tail fiber domain-containing protein [Flavobacterium proteolyticum]|uniref:Tail fiber domain-containing protein n=1 Tax=Flavobacterium proteolyticum TaxID=2911683 RepID=A0ABR9WNJ3_9FLAO|nr:tail fiber domain-containing protein [Flavobacterium proteolyticum]MBE9575491.1 tail fiber domain-containing protein [Flavobacterium proteolyticum]